MDKVTIFGAGHVGATTAFYLALSASVDIALVDIEPGRAEGLALDIGQSLPYAGSGSRIAGSSESSIVEGSGLVIITAGFPRLPGMSRLDLTARNAPVVAEIARDVAALAPGAVIVVVTNPVDEMTHLAWRSCGFEPRRVMGMAGVLDTSRFLYFLDRLASVHPGDTSALVLGSHGDDMIPLPEYSSVAGTPLAGIVDRGLLDEVIERTRDGGAEIVGCMKTGSAYFAPAVSIGVMALAIMGDTGRVLPVSAYLEGQYGISGIFIGVPVRLGRGGVVEILELPLSEAEVESLRRAADGVRARIDSATERS
jgi:malate dehydrogenase